MQTISIKEARKKEIESLEASLRIVEERGEGLRKRIASLKKESE